MCVCVCVYILKFLTHRHEAHFHNNFLSTTSSFRIESLFFGPPQFVNHFAYNRYELNGQDSKPTVRSIKVIYSVHHKHTVFRNWYRLFGVRFQKNDFSIRLKCSGAVRMIQCQLLDWNVTHFCCYSERSEMWSISLRSVHWTMERSRRFNSSVYVYRISIVKRIGRRYGWICSKYVISSNFFFPLSSCVLILLTIVDW